MKTLKQFLQKYAYRQELGGETGDAAKQAADIAEQAHADLRDLQSVNEKYFRSYWIVLVVAFITTLVFALMYRNEMGGLSVVLGAGGVVQGGLILQLSAALKEKSRIDMIAALSRRLNPDQLYQILKALLDDSKEQVGSLPGNPGGEPAKV